VSTPDLSTLAQRMRFAATVLIETNLRYRHHEEVPWRASELNREARHVEDEDQETAEREAWTEELARTIANKHFEACGSLQRWNDLPGSSRSVYRGIAKHLIGSGWTKDTNA
jgi:hypothetical protein